MATFFVCGYASGEWSQFVEAETEQEALAKVRAEMDRDDWMPSLDTCDDADIWSVIKPKVLGAAE